MAHPLFHALEHLNMAANQAPQSARDRAAGLSPAAARMLAEADKALAGNQVIAAERSLLSVLALSPDCAEANRLMGVASMMQGRADKAVEFLRTALAASPDDVLIHMNLGSALFESGAAEQGLSSLRRACELAPGMVAAWYNLGRALKVQAYIEEARDALHSALAADPAHIKARMLLGDVLTSLGDVAGAVASYRDVLRRQPGYPKAWFELANLKTEKFSQNDVAQLRQLLRQPKATADARVWLGFALAKALEDQGDYAASFDVLSEANTVRRRYVNWNADEQRRRVEAIMATFAQPMPAPLDVTLGQEVTFIVSLPRSGSNLTEQILASHPQVEGANEITDLPQIIEDESRRRGQPFPLWVNTATAQDWQRLGKEYMARTERWRQHKPRHTDKNLDNWELVGAIMAMLPGARIVNSRRDPLETCLACYRQLFSYGAHFSYDLNDMVSYYAGYDRLSQYWQRLFPQRVFDHAYEMLQADPESHIRRLLAFCDLPFDPACVNFHQTERTVISTASAAQVRQPLRLDTARGPRYGSKLDPLRARLSAAGLIADRTQ
jgi:tetratricopeptide (TPR) repeat protein